MSVKIFKTSGQCTTHDMSGKLYIKDNGHSNDISKGATMWQNTCDFLTNRKGSHTNGAHFRIIQVSKIISLFSKKTHT